MKKTFFGIIILFFLLSATAYTDEYKDDLINALVGNDFKAIENILKTNISAMSATDKRRIMNLALNYSSGDNTVKVCELLLKYDIRPNGFDLYTAINRDRKNSAIQFLLQNGAAPNGEILLLTMQKQRFDFAKQFIESDVDVNYRYPTTKKYADGMTPLLYASKWKNFEMVKLLVEHGANINIQAANEDTALSIARKNNSNTIYKYLAEHGAIEHGAIEHSAIEQANNNMPLQNDGISSILGGNESINFQRGTYRLSNGTIEIKILGNTNSGNINYTKNERVHNGFYTIQGNNLTIIMENRTFVYKIDSDISFSGIGEKWVRIGN